MHQHGVFKVSQYNKLADQLIEKVSKDDLVECARLLALNVAHYESKYGELPLDETLAMISMTKPNEDQLLLMANGMEILVGVLGNVVVGIGHLSTGRCVGCPDPIGCVGREVPTPSRDR